MGITEEVLVIIDCPLTILSWSARNPNFLGLNHQKAVFFAIRIRLKPLSVNAFIMNLQALFSHQD